MSSQVTPLHRVGKPVAVAQSRLGTGSWHRQQRKRIALRVAQPPDPTLTRHRDGARDHRVGLLQPSKVPIPETVEPLNRFQLSASCSLGLPAQAHAPDHPDEAVRFLVTAIDTAADIGSEWLTGALYAHLGHLTGAAPTSGEIDTIATVLRSAADHAQERGIRLGIEIINGYETHLVNSAVQAADLLDRIDRPGIVFAHLDTFHMNLEEPGIREAVRLLGPRLGYIHLAESNRGPIGSGLFPFRSLFDALNGIGFSGPAIVEAFINAPPDFRTATASWRPVAGDAATFVSESLEHIKSLLRTT